MEFTNYVSRIITSLQEQSLHFENCLVQKGYLPYNLRNKSSVQSIWCPDREVVQVIEKERIIGFELKRVIPHCILYYYHKTQNRINVIFG